MLNLIRSNKLTKLLAVIAIMFVVAATIVVILKRNIFAEIITAPIVYTSADPANGTGRMTFNVWANFNLTSAYVWWDCNVLDTDDTKAELVAKCGTPYELTSGSGSTGSKTAGARLEPFSNRASYKITLPPKANAKFVAFVTGANVPEGKVATRTYSTQADRTMSADGATNYSFRVTSPSSLSARYIAENLTDPDGILPVRKYLLWFDCNYIALTPTTSATDVTASCGNPKSVVASGDRLNYVNSFTDAISRRAVVIVQERKCTTFSYTGSTGCTFSPTIYVGAKDYTVRLVSTTPTQTVASVIPSQTATTAIKLSPTATANQTVTTVSKISPTPTPSPAQTASDTVPSATPTQDTYQLRQGFNALGSNVAPDREALRSAGLYLYKFDGSNNKWLRYPSDQFTPKAFEGYYVWAPQAQQINLARGLYLTSTFRVGNGWNLLWTNQSRNKDTLMLTIGSVTKSAKDWIASGSVREKIFEISDDSASQACNYFRILSDTTSSPNCSANTPGTVNQLSAGKAFWVFVN